MASASDASSDVCAVEISDESSSSSTTTKKKDISTNGAHHSSDNGNGDNHEDKSESLLLEQFIAACTPQLKFPADEPIIKKLKKHYENVAIDVRQSDEFHSMLEKFTIQVKKKGDQTYVVIQEVVNKFKSYKSQSDSDLARKAHVKKLEKLLRRLDRKIKKLEEAEVDWSEDENSGYMVEDLYKKKFAKVYSTLCEVVGQGDKEPLAKIVYNGSRYPEINKSVTKFLKKNTDVFPDYKTILEIIEDTNKGCVTLRLCEENIAEEAKIVFEAVGKLFKNRRIEEFKWTLGCHLTDDIELLSDDSRDPAVQNPELKLKLEANQEIGCKNLNEVINKYAKLQEERKEEPTEYDDKIEEEVSEGSDEEKEMSVDDDELDAELESSPPTSGRSSPIVSDIDDTSRNIKASQSLKRERSSVENEVNASKPAKKRAAIVPFIKDNDDDVIVLSD